MSRPTAERADLDLEHLDAITGQLLAELRAHLPAECDGLWWALVDRLAIQRRREARATVAALTVDLSRGWATFTDREVVERTRRTVERLAAIHGLAVEWDDRGETV